MRDDKLAFSMIKRSDMANLSFLKMKTFTMEESAPAGKQTSEELNCIAEEKNPLSNTIHNAQKINRR